ncbi:MAG TPA: hypothetical protein VFN44_22855 [Solirubrobacteraceae bacterium]|nr:hypothetical protein [Solirubrobacteraceae bacterium]
MSGLGETKFGFCSVMPTETCFPRVSSDFHSGSGVGSAAGCSAGVAVGVGVVWARGGAGSSFSPQAEHASASAPAVVASARRRI